MQCPHCHAENPPTAQLCSSCGTPLHSPPDAERKLVTVLFADLIGHTEIETRVDPEDWRTVLHSYFAEMAKSVHRYGGTVEKFIGDAVFAVFGVPRGHEDDAERAARAAVDMQEALKQLNLLFTRQLGAPLQLRIGLATGEAIAPRETKHDQLVTGELTSLAERLQKQAPPNGIVLSEPTYRLVAPLVEVEPLGYLTLKGFPASQQAFVLRRLQVGVQKPRGIGVDSPLVGRERELEMLIGARDKLLSGQGRVVAIIGEAGLGKSRLITEVRARLEIEVTFLEARCYEFTQATAYGVVVQHLRSYLNLAETAPLAAGRAQLASTLQKTSGSRAADTQQALEHLLGLDVTHDFEERSRGLQPDEVRSIVVQAITAFWEAIAKRGPLVLMIEDLHWVDSASAGVLGDLLQMLERVPLMVLCALRPERRSLAWEFKVEAERDYPHRYDEVRLEPLSQKATEHLASILLERLGLSLDLKTLVARRAEGNPFYVEEMVRSLKQQGPSSATGPRLPETLRGVLQARLDALPSPTRRVLQAASVIGRTFPLRLLQVLSGANGDLDSHLSILQRTEFVYELERLPEPQYAFKHMLLLEAAYQALLRQERREFHRQLAEALEQESPAGPVLPLLVHHYLHSEVWEKAFLYAVKAGDAAYSLSALEDALQHYDIAARVARDQPKCVTDQFLLLKAQKARGDILSFLGRYAEAQRHFEELLAQYRGPEVRAGIYRSIGLLNIRMGKLREAHASLRKAVRIFKEHSDPEEEARTYRGLAIIMERRRDYARALEYAHWALAVAERQSLRMQMRDIYSTLMATHFFGGDVEQSIRYAEESLHLALQSNNQIAIVESRNNLANHLLFKGSIREALQEAEEALALAVKLGLGVPQVLVQITLAEIFLERGRWQDAAEILASSEEVVHRYALGAVWQANVRRNQAFASLLRGLGNDAVKQLQEAKFLEERGGIARNLPRIHRGLAEAYLSLGNYNQAQTHALKAKKYERRGNPIETPAALQILAVIARGKGHIKRAVRLLEESLSLMQARKASGEYARVLLELAKTHAAASRMTKARELLEESITIYAALDATPLVESARRTAAQLESEGGPR